MPNKDILCCVVFIRSFRRVIDRSAQVYGRWRAWKSCRVPSELLADASFGSRAMMSASAGDGAWAGCGDVRSGRWDMLLLSTQREYAVLIAYVIYLSVAFL